MPRALISLDPDSGLSLQAQIRQEIVRLLLGGAWPASRRLPSSRELAGQLGVSRNTAVLACQQLLAEGYLVSRARSGLYVNPELLAGPVGFAHPSLRALPAVAVRRPGIARESSQRTPRAVVTPVTPEFSFVDGAYDPALYPAAAWREATRLSLGRREIEQWSASDGTLDDPMLVEEIRSKILPQRGIQAAREEILVTLGARQALSLLGDLCGGRKATIAVEEPGNPAARERFRRSGARLVHLPVDAQGIVLDERLDACTAAYVTPSHQVPTAVTMSIARRRRLLKRAAQTGLLVIEDDRVPESNYLGHPHPALRSLGHGENVIYVSSLSRVLGPWVRIGFMVGPPRLIAAARELRGLSAGHPPLNNQRAAAYFLALGHYDAQSKRLAREFRKRWTALRDALNHYLHRSIVMSPSMGGTAFWVRGPEDLDAAALVHEAARRGIALEPVERYFAAQPKPANCFRMGVSAVPLDCIRPGVVRLAQLFTDLGAGGVEQLESCRGQWLRGEELRAAVSGATVRLRTVYGDPCTIELCSDGRMLGRAGARDEDCDTGRWWIDGDLWHRQWDRWGYGEAIAFYTVIDGTRIKWFKLDRRLADVAEIDVPPH
jgi:GntR family transcriptional regulator/MocR family aminotransferase